MTHMAFFCKQIPQRLLFYTSFLLLVLVLAACNGSGSAHTNSSGAALTSTSLTPTPGTTLKTYTGTHFRLTYSGSWIVQGSGNQIIFQDAKGLNALTVIVLPNPNGAKSAAKLANATFLPVEKAVLTNPQTTSVSSTITLAGETWVQQSATGTLSTGGQSGPGTLLLLLANHPASSPATQAYEIYYGGPTTTFQQIDPTFFQPMLQSFSFAA